jgi:hypothetical protein
MIPAYHFVPGRAALERVLAEGQILPAIFRLTAETVRGLCKETLDLVLKMYVNPPEPVLVGLQALRDLAAEAAEHYAAAPGAKPGFQTTKLQCVDILSGDGARVFLSPWKWPLVTRGKPTGLVYDAEDLVRKGARYRPRDLLFDYTDAVWRGLGAWLTVENAKAAIVRGLRDVSMWEYQGDDALTGLRASEGTRAEIVWEGPLPVDGAREIWFEGERVK